MTLEKFKRSDIPFIYQALSHPEIIKYYGFRCTSYQDAVNQFDWYSSHYEDKRGLWFKIVQDNQSIGAIGFNDYNIQNNSFEIGFWLLPEFWGKRIIDKVFPIALIELSKLCNAPRIKAIIESENSSSIRLIERLGFTKINYEPKAELKNDKWIDLIAYEYQQMNK